MHLLWFSGNLYPSAMRVLQDGRLHVSFTTRAGFNGKFLHPQSKGNDLN